MKLWVEIRAKPPRLLPLPHLLPVPAALLPETAVPMIVGLVVLPVVLPADLLAVRLVDPMVVEPAESIKLN